MTLIAEIEDYLTTLTPPAEPVTIAEPVVPASTASARLMIQGDIAFMPGEKPAGMEMPPVRWHPLTGAFAVLPGEVATDGHTHWLIPSGAGVTWLPEHLGHLLGRLHVPDGVSVLVHHDASPVEHDDLTLTSGIWGVRRQMFRLEAAPARVVAVLFERHPNL